MLFSDLHKLAQRKGQTHAMSKTKFLLLALFAVVGLSFASIWVFNIAPGDGFFWTWDPQANIATACRQHVREAEQKAAQAMVRRSSEFSDFINSRKGGAKPFSKDMISYAGRWLAVKPYLPFTKNDGHKKYVVEKFDQHIFTSEDLARAVKRAVEGSVKDLDGIENELAVALRKEISGQSLSPDETPIVTDKFKKSIDHMVSASQLVATNEVGKLVASGIVEEIGSKVLVRLGVTAGVIGTGAANSFWSLGASLVISLAIDAIWGWFVNSAGKIEREMIATLDKLSLDASTAIRFEMYKVISQRSELWNKTVTEILP